MRLLASIALLLVTASPASGESAMSDARFFGHEAGIWSIANQGSLRRWIVIHDPGSARKSGVAHIEVLGREAGSPSWNVRRLCVHMAIRVEALKRSVRSPLTRGAVYPEAFDDAFAQWKAAAEAGRASVCNRTVNECLASCERARE